MKEIAQTCCSKANKTKVNVSRNVMLAAEFDSHSQKTTTIVVSRLYGITLLSDSNCTQNWGKAGSWIVTSETSSMRTKR